jgi:hypothetical protein
MLIGNLRDAAALKVATTQAAPPMSARIASIFPGGFRLMPPVSKVTPLPANKYYKKGIKFGKFLIERSLTN